MANYVNFTKATFNPYNPRALNEGQFSWMTHDTGKQIGSERQNTIDVWMYDNEGNSWYEKKYDGYGEFGGMDYYELLARMNGYSEEDLEDKKVLKAMSYGKEMRDIGISLAFDKLPTKDKKRKVLFPALSSSPKYNWKRHDFTQEAESDPNQSWYDSEDPYGEYDDYYDESVSEKVEPGEYSGLYYDTAEKVLKRERIKVPPALIDSMLKRAHEDGHLEYTAKYVRDAEKDIRAAIDKIGEDDLRMYAFGASESVVTENYEVFYSDGMRAMKAFPNERKARAFFDDKIKQKGMREVALYKAGSGFHSTTQTERVIAFWGDSSYLDNVSKKDADLAKKKVNEAQKYDLEYAVKSIKDFNRGKYRGDMEELAKDILKDLGFDVTKNNIEATVDHLEMSSEGEDIPEDKDMVRELYPMLENASLSWDSLKESLGLNEAIAAEKLTYKGREIRDREDFEVGDIIGNTVDGFYYEILKFVGGRKVQLKDVRNNRKFVAYKSNYELDSDGLVEEGRSINKISKDHANTVVQMSDTAKEWKESDGDRKSELLDKLRALNKKKSDLEKELDAAVAGKDRGLELSLQEAEELAYLEIEVNKILEEAQNNEEN